MNTDEKLNPHEENDKFEKRLMFDSFTSAMASFLRDKEETKAIRDSKMKLNNVK